MACAQCGASAAKLRCSRCKRTFYCQPSCQKDHWKTHKAQCLIMAASLVSTGTASREAPFVEAIRVPTRGAAGWTHFEIDGQNYLCVANFFSSSPGVQPSMKTESVVYRTFVTDSGKFQMDEHQKFTTTGAHGVEHVSSDGQNYIIVPNYYGGDAVVLRWTGKKFKEHQRLVVDGGGSVIQFQVGDKQMIGIAEFNKGKAAVYVLKNGRFELWQNIHAPGCGAMTTVTIEDQLYLITSSYVTRQTGWRTRSQVFVLNDKATAFESHHEIPTVGAHGVTSLSLDVDGTQRHYIFFSNDKDERTTKQDSELFEWRNGKFVSRQRIPTDGAHAAELFVAANGKSYLAVANLGDRATDSYRRDSVLYELDPIADSKPLKMVQKFPTLGATDFHSFDIKGRTFLAVSNEQDDRLGGNIESTIWTLKLEGDGAKQDEL